MIILNIPKIGIHTKLVKYRFTIPACCICIVTRLLAFVEIRWGHVLVILVIVVLTWMWSISWIASSTATTPVGGSTVSEKFEKYKMKYNLWFLLLFIWITCSDWATCLDPLCNCPDNLPFGRLCGPCICIWKWIEIWINEL